MLQSKLMRATSALAVAAMITTAVAPAMAFGGTVKLAGSTSLQPLAQQWANAYHKTHPGTSIVAAGGGSGAGFTAAKSGSANIGMSSKSAAESDAA
ncbi:MAG: substrate-binding domain-containing protein [Actinomycetes bacterium]